MTPLARYLAEHRQTLTRAAFAKRARISAPYLTELAAGRKGPSLRVALRIERATGGAVRAAELLTPEPGQ